MLALDQVSHIRQAVYREKLEQNVTIWGESEVRDFLEMSSEDNGFCLAVDNIATSKVEHSPSWLIGNGSSSLLIPDD